MLKIISPTPTNNEIAKTLGKTEGAVRVWKKNLSDIDVELMNLNYKKDNFPFVKVEEFLQIMNEDKILSGDYSNSQLLADKDLLCKAVEEKKIVGSFYTDGNNIKNLYIPPILSQLSEIKEVYSENQIKKPITISIGNHKGGANKTTNTTNVASTLAYFGYKVLIVDFDPQGNASASFGIFEGDYKNTIIDLITMSSEPNIETKVKESVINIDLTSKFENGIMGRLDLIANHAAMSEKVEDLPIMTRSLGTIENTLDRVLSYVKSDYDFILIDLPPRTDVILRTAMMASDYFIISLNPQPFAKMGMPNILNPIKKYEHIYKQEKGRNFKILGGIVGFYEKGVTVQDIIYEQMQKDILECTEETSSLFNTTIPKSTIIQESQQGDGSILFSQPSSKIVRNYFDLTIEILERILINEMSEEV